MSRRLVVGLTVVSLFVTGNLTAAPPLTAAQLAAQARAAVLAEVRAAAAPERVREEDQGASSPEAGDAARADGAGDAPSAGARDGSVTLRPDTPETISDEGLGVTAQFSGHEIGAAVSLTVGEAQTQTPVTALRARGAVSELPGTPVGEVIEITAVDAAGELVHEFPAKMVPALGGDPGHGPSVMDVVPGIRLQFAVDQARVEAAGVAPRR